MSAEPCIVFTSDVKILVKENGLYTYPDAMVVCGPLEYAEGRTDTITNPILIVEVLSKSTRGYDWDKKFELYRALESLQDYIPIDQEESTLSIIINWKMGAGYWFSLIAPILTWLCLPLRPICRLAGFTG